MPPPARIWSRVSSSFSGVRATSSTVPPASAIFSAADLPIPEEAPVTMTIRPRTAASSETLPTQLAAEPHQLVGDLLLEDLGEPADQAEAPAGGADQRLVAEQVRVEMALPVVPELARVGLERRHADPGALERRLGLARVEVGRVVDVDEDRARDAEVGEDAVEDRVGERRRRQSRP